MLETDDHHRLRQTVREVTVREVEPYIARMEATQSVEAETSSRLAAQGWIGVTIPRTFGGMGAGHLAKTILIEEVSRVSAAMGAMVQASLLGTAMILHFGTEEQKQRWLPAVAAGHALPTIAVTEEESGGHVLGMQATAHRDGDDYILNGRKVFVGNSHIGHVHGVVVRTDPHPSNSRSLSAFLVEADAPGLHLAPHQPAMGLHGFSFGELVMQDCRIPATNRLGEVGDGLDVAYSSSVLYGRPNLTAVALGILQALVEETVAFAKERHRFGRPLAEHPVIQQRIGQLEHQLRTARTIAYQAVDLLDHGRPCDNELINAKLYAADAVVAAARDAVRVHGAAGLRKDRPIERLYRDAALIDAPAGTSDIQRRRLAETALDVGHRQWSERFAHLTALHPPGASSGRDHAA